MPSSARHYSSTGLDQRTKTSLFSWSLQSSKEQSINRIVNYMMSEGNNQKDKM